MPDIATLPAQFTPEPLRQKEKLLFDLPHQAECQIIKNPAGGYPLASPDTREREPGSRGREEEDPSEGWIFKAKKRGSTRVTPRTETTQASPLTPQRTPTPEDKRGALHSDTHRSFFESPGILAPIGREPFRARLWPVLTRIKDSRKETLMCLKEHTPPGLPLIIRLKGPAETLEEEWTPDIAWEELIHRVETELKEQTLRLNFSIKEKLHLEWA
ncbi:unnamed protein product [Sphagnum troendelagicum]|uniref:Uncharacterized protein n=1 Tax=Sphagnum troendelagicum TaxID=128251 RepID=A0ABP0TC89_9BRYO